MTQPLLEGWAFWLSLLALAALVWGLTPDVRAMLAALDRWLQS